MSSASWSDFSVKMDVDVNDTSFNDPIGGNFLGVGTHKNVTIASIEPQKDTGYGPNFKVVFEDDNDASISTFISIIGKPKDDGSPQYHFKYKMLGMGLCKDDQLRIDFFVKHALSNPEAFNCLVGMKVTIVVEPGKKGVDIKDGEMGGKILWDVAENAQVEDTVAYETFEEARDTIKEMGLKRMYPQVTRLSRPDDEFLTTNENTLQETIDGGKKKKAKKTSVKDKVKVQATVSIDDIDI